MNTKNILGFFLLLMAITGTARAQQGNGGAGVKKNGVYMSFYSAGLYVEPVDISLSPTPLPAALNSLISYVSQLQYIGSSSRTQLLNALIPSGKRKYFIADPAELTPEIEARLLAEFSRVTQVDTADLKLMALTDTATGTTFILPKFFELSTNDQIAILFHEAYWILHPSTSYQNVVHAEMAFQAAYEKPSDPAIIYDFTRYVGTHDEAFEQKMKWELAAGNLKGALINVNQLPMRVLFGQTYGDCNRKAAPKGPGIIDRVFNSDSLPNALHFATECDPFFRLNLNQLLAQYPKSMVLRMISENFDNTDTDNTYNSKVSQLIGTLDKGNKQGWKDFQNCSLVVDAPQAQNMICSKGGNKAFNFSLERTQQ